MRVADGCAVVLMCVAVETALTDIWAQEGFVLTDAELDDEGNDVDDDAMTSSSGEAAPPGAEDDDADDFISDAEAHGLVGVEDDANAVPSATGGAHEGPGMVSDGDEGGDEGGEGPDHYAGYDMDTSEDDEAGCCDMCDDGDDGDDNDEEEWYRSPGTPSASMSNVDGAHGDRSMGTGGMAGGAVETQQEQQQEEQDGEEFYEAEEGSPSGHVDGAGVRSRAPTCAREAKAASAAEQHSGSAAVPAMPALASQGEAPSTGGAPREEPMCSPSGTQQQQHRAAAVDSAPAGSAEQSDDDGHGGHYYDSHFDAQLAPSTVQILPPPDPVFAAVTAAEQAAAPTAASFWTATATGRELSQRGKACIPLRQRRAGNFVAVKLIAPENLMSEYHDDHDAPNIDVQYIAFRGVVAAVP